MEVAGAVMGVALGSALCAPRRVTRGFFFSSPCWRWHLFVCSESMPQAAVFLDAWVLRSCSDSHKHTGHGPCTLRRDMGAMVPGRWRTWRVREPPGSQGGQWCDLRKGSAVSHEPRALRGRSSSSLFLSLASGPWLEAGASTRLCPSSVAST